MYRGVSYVLYTYDLHHNFVRSPTVEKFNSPADFSQSK